MLFIFDMDNVLYDYHWRVRMEALTAITGHDFHELRRRWWHDEGEWKAEAGQPDTGEEYLARVNDAFGSSITREHWLSLRREAMAFRPGVLPAVEFASRYGQVTLLTNNGMLVGEHLPEVAPELVPVLANTCLRPRTMRRENQTPLSTRGFWSDMEQVPPTLSLSMTPPTTSAEPPRLASPASGFPRMIRARRSSKQLPNLLDPGLRGEIPS